MKLFLGNVIKKIINIIVISGGEVTDPKIQIDMPEIAPTPTDTNAVGVTVNETAPPPTEEVIAGILLSVEELPPAAADTVTLATVINETFPTPGDMQAVGIIVNEGPPAPTDDITAIIAALLEVAPTPVETTPIDVTVAFNETPPAPTDLQAIGIVANEIAPTPTDEITLIAAILNETAPTPTEATPLSITVAFNETPPAPVDSATIGNVITETAPGSSDEGYTQIDMQWLWPDAIISGSTGWATTGNMSDKSDSTAATLAATSSGIVPGTTSNTTNGDMSASLPNPVITDLTITQVQLLVRHECLVTAGTALSGQAHSMVYQYSTDNGSNWTTVQTDTTFPRTLGTDTYDITSAIGGDWTKINNFRVRAVGSVTSGLGVASNVTVTERWYSSKLRIQANKTY